MNIFIIWNRESLPPCPSVLQSGYLYLGTTDSVPEVVDLKELKSVYCIATTDCFFHILFGNKYEVPEISIYLDENELVSIQTNQSNGMV